MIVPEAINTPGADDAAKALVITPFITQAMIMVGYFDGHRDTQTRLTTANLERIIQHGVARNIKYDWFFEVGMSHIHFTSVDADLDYQNFDVTSMSIAPIPAAAGVPAAATSRRSSGTGPSSADIGAAVGAAVAGQLASAISPGYGRSHGGFSGPAAAYVFNVAALRADVRQHYDWHLEE